jgi:hypothetical protein
MQDIKPKVPLYLSNVCLFDRKEAIMCLKLRKPYSTTEL